MDDLARATGRFGLIPAKIVAPKFLIETPDAYGGTVVMESSEFKSRMELHELAFQAQQVADANPIPLGGAGMELLGTPAADATETHGSSNGGASNIMIPALAMGAIGLLRAKARRRSKGK